MKRTDIGYKKTPSRFWNVPKTTIVIAVVFAQSIQFILLESIFYYFIYR